MSEPMSAKTLDDYPLRVVGRAGLVTHAAARMKPAWIMSACGKYAGYESQTRPRMAERGADVTCGLCRRFLFTPPVAPYVGDDDEP